MIWGVRVRGKAFLACNDVCCENAICAEKKGISEVSVSSVANVGLEGGGEACSDIEHPRGEPALFGQVASDTTAYRTLTGIDEEFLERVRDAAAGVRVRAWSRRRVDPGRPLVLDIDSTLVEIHSQNKHGAAPHYKRGYGFGPMLCSAGDGEPLWVKLRPGNAAANNIADRLEVLDRSIGGLREAFAAGHRPGDAPAMAAQPMWLRTDSAGCSAQIAQGCGDRNVTFFATARENTQITAAIAAVHIDHARLDAAMRAHAHVDHTVARLTDSGLNTMPFRVWDANAARTALCVISLALVSWFQQLRLTGALAKAAPKQLRRQLWHTPARIVRTARRTTARLPDHHPGTPALLAARARN